MELVQSLKIQISTVDTKAATDAAKGLAEPLGNLFDLTAKVLAVAAILLPVVGLVVRFTRFFGLPTDVITAEDPTSLIIDGWRADAGLLVPFVVLIVAIATLRAPAVMRSILLIASAPVIRGIVHEITGSSVSLVTAIVVAGFGMFAWDLIVWSRPLLGAAAYGVSCSAGLALIFVGLRAGPRLDWLVAAVLSIVIVGGAAISVGTHAWKPRAMEVTFTTDSTLRPGWYGQLGHTADNVYLVSCESPQRVLQVAQSTIVSATYSAIQPTVPSGLDAVGYQPGCEHE